MSEDESIEFELITRVVWFAGTWHGGDLGAVTLKELQRLIAQVLVDVGFAELYPKHGAYEIAEAAGIFAASTIVRRAGIVSGWDVGVGAVDFERLAIETVRSLEWARARATLNTTTPAAVH